MFQAIKFQNIPGQAKAGFTSIGPIIKVNPFQKWPKLSIQSTWQFPVKKDLQGRASDFVWLSHNGHLSWTQIFFDHPLGTQFSFFGELDFLYYLDRRGDNNNSWATTSYKAFMSYFPTSKITLYGFGDFSPTHNNAILSSFYLQLGGGGKYQLSNNLVGELLFSKFAFGKNSGAGSTYNLGLRYLH